MRFLHVLMVVILMMKNFMKMMNRNYCINSIVFLWIV